MASRSPSTRRAWIEIPAGRVGNSPPAVALHPEGVDRNHDLRHHSASVLQSPSTRRAWIEIKARYTTEPPLARRPPPGGRG